jgi:Domain of unknown function (DUF4872)
LPLTGAWQTRLPPNLAFDSSTGTLAAIYYDSGAEPGDLGDRPPGNDATTPTAAPPVAVLGVEQPRWICSVGRGPGPAAFRVAWAAMPCSRQSRPEPHRLSPAMPIPCTGGGIFRFMYARFLGEAAVITAEPHLAGLQAELAAIGDQWEAVAAGFDHAARAENPMGELEAATEPMSEIADREQDLWTRLAGVITA